MTNIPKFSAQESVGALANGLGMARRRRASALPAAVSHATAGTVVLVTAPWKATQSNVPPLEAMESAEAVAEEGYAAVGELAEGGSGPEVEANEVPLEGSESEVVGVPVDSGGPDVNALAGDETFASMEAEAFAEPAGAASAGSREGVDADVTELVDPESVSEPGATE